VRLLHYVLLELTVGVVGLGAVGAGLKLGAEVWADRRAERVQQELARHYPKREDLSRPPVPRITGDASGTFLGMSDELLLARVRDQPITGVKLNRGGSSLSFRVEFADGSRAAFKPAQTNLQTIPRKEVAAYRLNRLLGLNAVPPAVPYSLHKNELLGKLHPESRFALPRIKAETIFNPLGETPGVFSYWIPVVKDSGFDTPDGLRQTAEWLMQGTFIPPDKRRLAAQLSDLVVFDFLTANPDRYSGGNMKMSADGEHLFYMDNTLSFFLRPEGHSRNRAALEKAQRFSRHLYRALSGVTLEALEEAMWDEHDGQEVLTPSEIRAVVARRDVALKHIKTVAQAYGEEQVLVFP